MWSTSPALYSATSELRWLAGRLSLCARVHEFGSGACSRLMIVASRAQMLCRACDVVARRIPRVPSVITTIFHCGDFGDRLRTGRFLLVGRELCCSFQSRIRFVMSMACDGVRSMWKPPG